MPKPKLRRDQQPQVQQRPLGRQLDPEEERQRDRGGDRQLDDEGRAEPVVLVAFLEHGLQRAEADRHGEDPRPVAGLEQRELHRRALEREPQHADHQRAGHEVDVEDVLPAPVLREIAADGRADRRREGGRKREQRKPDRLLGPRQDGDDDGEGHRDQHAAGEALDGAQHDHLLEVVRLGAGHREDEEQDRVGQQVAAHREDLRRPAAQAG